MLELRPCPPFRLELTAWALRRRPQNTIDRWDGSTYRRTLLVKRRPVAVAVTQTAGGADPRLQVMITGEEVPASVEAAVVAALTRLLGIDLDLSDFYARAQRDIALGELAQRYRGLKPPRFLSVFECLLNAVACQQLSLAAGLTVLSRLAVAARTSDREPQPCPDPEDVLGLEPGQLRELGFSERKAQTILQLAGAAANGDFGLERFERLDDHEAIAQLVRLPGIGRWSADYVLLRCLGRRHVFPSTDVGALGGLRRFLAAAGLDDDPVPALQRWAADAGLLYFHLLLRGLDERGWLLGLDERERLERPAESKATSG